MYRTKRTRPPARQAVLIVSHPDGFIEAYADKNVDVHFARVPTAYDRRNEAMAEDCMTMMTPRRYGRLYQADLRRAVGTTRPLTAEAAHAAIVMEDSIGRLNMLANCPAEAGAA